MWCVASSARLSKNSRLGDLVFVLCVCLTPAGWGRTKAEGSLVTAHFTLLFLPEEQVFQKKGQGTSYYFQNESS